MDIETYPRSSHLRHFAPIYSHPATRAKCRTFSPEIANVSLALLVSNGLIVGKDFPSRVVGTVLLSPQQLACGKLSLLNLGFSAPASTTLALSAASRGTHQAAGQQVGPLCIATRGPLNLTVTATHILYRFANTIPLFFFII